MSEFVVITGLSGAGRSQAADDLEDLGWFVIDNLPAALIPQGRRARPARRARRHRAGGPRRRAPAPTTTSCTPALDELRAAGARVRQSCSSTRRTDVLVRRYEGTRRRHPLRRAASGWPRPSSASARCSSR